MWVFRLVLVGVDLLVLWGNRLSDSVYIICCAGARLPTGATRKAKVLAGPRARLACATSSLAMACGYGGLQFFVSVAAVSWQRRGSGNVFDFKRGGLHLRRPYQKVGASLISVYLFFSMG